MKKNKTFLIFLFLPGVITGLLPGLIIFFDPLRPPGEYNKFALLIIIPSVLLIFRCSYLFFKIGQGTIAPWAPPKKLVLAGPYKYSRNPIFLGMLLTVTGCVLFYNSVFLAIYNFMLFIFLYLRIIICEEPHLENNYGQQWKTYKNKVSRWL